MPSRRLLEKLKKQPRVPLSKKYLGELVSSGREGVFFDERRRVLKFGAELRTPINFRPQNYFEAAGVDLERAWRLAVADAWRHACLYRYLVKREIYPPGTRAFVYTSVKDGETCPAIGLAIPKLRPLKSHSINITHVFANETPPQVLMKIAAINKHPELAKIASPSSDIYQIQNWGRKRRSNKYYFFDTHFVSFEDETGEGRLTLPHDWKTSNGEVPTLFEAEKKLFERKK